MNYSIKLRSGAFVVQNFDSYSFISKIMIISWKSHDFLGAVKCFGGRCDIRPYVLWDLNNSPPILSCCGL